MRTLAIGDIHGCSSHLDSLLTAVAPTADDLLVFLGDYIDRGPDSRGVIDRILKLSASLRVVALRGNHELFVLQSRTDREAYLTWLNVGGAQTLGSYGPAPGRAGTLADVPEAHWEFLEKTCRPYYETATHIFAHANLDADVPLEEQTDRYLYWEFLSAPVAHASGKILVCGHSSQKSGAILDLGTTICIDTYAYGGGKLTCLDVTSRRFWQADIIGRVTESELMHG